MDNGKDRSITIRAPLALLMSGACHSLKPDHSAQVRAHRATVTKDNGCDESPRSGPYGSGHLRETDETRWHKGRCPHAPINRRHLTTSRQSLCHTLYHPSRTTNHNVYSALLAYALHP